MQQPTGSEDDWHLPVWAPPSAPGPSGTVPVQDAASRAAAGDAGPDEDDGFVLQDPPAPAGPAPESADTRTTGPAAGAPGAAPGGTGGGEPGSAVPTVAPTAVPGSGLPGSVQTPGRAGPREPGHAGPGLAGPPAGFMPPAVPPMPAEAPVPQAPAAPRRPAPYAAAAAPQAAVPGAVPPAPLRPADSTGHVPLPPGVPVPVPVPFTPEGGPLPAPHEGGTGTATLAVLLIGPAGAGKTTVARHWARTRRVPTAHISLDDVREWVCSGFADPQSGWNEHSEAQYRLARRTCGFAARNFLANGISCILDDAVFPDRPVIGLGGWKRHVGPGLLPVVLLPGLEVVLERNAKREGNRRLSDEEVAGIHGRMAGWYGSGLPIIDNSTYDVPTTARMLDDVLAQSVASPSAW
jgi:hypothetical protein